MLPLQGSLPSSILVTCSNASMAEGIMHRTLNPAIKVRVLVGVLTFGALE